MSPFHAMRSVSASLTIFQFTIWQAGSPRAIPSPVSLHCPQFNISGTSGISSYGVVDSNQTVLIKLSPIQVELCLRYLVPFLLLHATVLQIREGGLF
jgi:hypothetical protein